GGADGYSFHSSGWTERLLRRGGEAQNGRSRPLDRTTAGAWAFPLRHSSCGAEIRLYATFATSSRLADNWGVASARKAVAKLGGRRHVEVPACRKGCEGSRRLPARRDTGARCCPDRARDH